MPSDQRGAREALVIQAAAYALILSPLVLFAMLPVRGAGWWIRLLLVDAAAGVATVGLHRLVSAAISGVIGRATGIQGGGGATTSHFAMSQVDSLIMQRRWDEAVAQLQAAMYAHDGETGAEIARALGDLLSFRLQRFEEAAPVYRRARRVWQSVGGVRGREGMTHCTRRLLDLYEGPLANPAAAEQERRRLGAPAAG